MNSRAAINNTLPGVGAATGAKRRRAVAGTDVAVLSSIYDEDVNMASWHRDLSEPLSRSVEQLLELAPAFALSLMTTPAAAYDGVAAALPNKYHGPLAEDVAEIVEMFCFLFDLKRTGLRLTALNEAMCPRFHVDKVPCRLITTFSGPSTEWLPQEAVDRTKLGMGYLGLPDLELGLYERDDHIGTMSSGDIALLKGEAWVGNEDGGLVHRSPGLSGGERRLLLTLDFGR